MFISLQAIEQEQEQKGVECRVTWECGVKEVVRIVCLFLWGTEGPRLCDSFGGLTSETSSEETFAGCLVDGWRERRREG